MWKPVRVEGLLTIAEAIRNIDLTNIHRRIKWPQKGKCYHLQGTFFIMSDWEKLQAGRTRRVWGPNKSDVFGNRGRVIKRIRKGSQAENLFSVYRRMDPRLSHWITLFLGKLLASYKEKNKSKFLVVYEIRWLLGTSSWGVECCWLYSAVHTQYNGQPRPAKSRIMAIYLKHKDAEVIRYISKSHTTLKT